MKKFMKVNNAVFIKTFLKWQNIVTLIGAKQKVKVFVYNNTKYLNVFIDLLIGSRQKKSIIRPTESSVLCYS